MPFDALCRTFRATCSLTNSSRDTGLSALLRSGCPPPPARRAGRPRGPRPGRARRDRRQARHHMQMNWRTMLPSAPRLILRAPACALRKAAAAAASSMRAARSRASRSVSSTRPSRLGTRMSHGQRASFIRSTRQSGKSPTGQACRVASRWVERESSAGHAASRAAPSAGRASRRSSRRCRRAMCAAPIGPAGAPAPKARIGTCSRVWSKPRKVGSLPWSAVMRQIIRPAAAPPRSRGAARRTLSRQAAKPGDVAAMAVFGVEIDEVDEDEPAVRRRLQRVEQQIDIAVVVLALALLAGVAMGENVADLADRDDRAAGLRGALQEGCRRAAARRNPCGWACGRSPSRVSPTKGRAITRPIFKRIAETPRDAAELVEPLEPERLLVRGDLKDRVGRGVADRLQRPHVLLAEFLDDGGAGGVAVAENAGELALARSARR